MQRTYQLCSTTAATTMGGTYVDSIANGVITGVVWNAAARWQAAIGNMFWWLAFTNNNDYSTSQIYNHISNFHTGGSFTAAGTGHNAAHSLGHYGLEVPFKLGQRLYLNVVLNGTGPTDILLASLIMVREG